MSRVNARERREINDSDWLYCLKCGKHWRAMFALGQWIGTHEGCGGKTDICWAPLRCNQFRRQIGLEMSRGSE